MDKILMGLFEKINQHPEELLDIQDYKRLLNKHNSLNNYDFINRVLAYVQNPDATDIRTKLEWEALGRDVKSDNQPIALIRVIKSSEYLESETHRKLDVHSSDLSLLEIKKAIELGLVYEKSSIAGFETLYTYDIKDTVSIGGSDILTKKPNPIANYEALEKLVSKVTNEGISLDNDDKLPNKVFKAMNIIVKYMVENKVNKVVKALNIHELNTEEIGLLRRSLVYSLCTLYKVRVNSEFNELEHIEVNRWMQILQIIDIIIKDILPKIEYDSVMREFDYEKVHRAERLYSLISAYNLNNKTKGA